jgi:DNA-binding transcriptional LysR family regulator
LLANFAKAHRKVNLTILTRDKTEIVSLLASGQADFGMARINMPAGQFLTRPLMSSRPCLVLPKGHFLYKNKSISLPDLRDCRFVFLPRNTTSRHLVEEKFYRSGFALNVSFEAWSCADIIDCVLLGLGPGIVHDICVPRRKNPLRVIDLTSIFGATDVNLITRKDKFLSRADRAFIKAIVSHRNSENLPAESTKKRKHLSAGTVPF